MKKIFTLLVLVFCLNSNAQVINTVAGGGNCGSNYCGDGGQATLAQLYGGTCAVNSSGNLYISDRGNSRIRYVDNMGVITTIVGTGTHGFSGDGGQATAAEIWGPSSIVFDKQGNFYFADFWNNRIRKVNSLGIISTIAGDGTSGHTGDGGPAIVAEVYDAEGVAIDSIGNLYIADWYYIRKIDTMGIITTVAGIGSSGFSGDGGPATAAAFWDVYGVALDLAGNIYAADAANNRIRKINTAGIITTIAGNGTQGSGGDGGQATAASLYYPTGVTIDAAGNLFIADQSNRVRKVNTSGIISTIAGTGTPGFSGDGGLATAAELNIPYNITFNVVGDLYISDSQNNRIRVVKSEASGINQLSKVGNQINIYPNPTQNTFTIETTTNKQTLQLFDVTGKMVLNQTIEGKTTIDVSILNDGVYNLSLINASCVINKKLVIIN